MTSATADRLYFRQLLSGRDFATGDQMARQMVNFVYLIGDRGTGEAVIVDPAYDVTGLLGAGPPGLLRQGHDVTQRTTGGPRHPGGVIVFRLGPTG